MAKKGRIQFGGQSFTAEPGEWVMVAKGIRMLITTEGTREHQLACTDCGEWFDAPFERCRAYDEFRDRHHYLCPSCIAKYVAWAKEKLVGVKSKIVELDQVVADVLELEPEDGLLGKLAIEVNRGPAIYPQERVVLSLMLNSARDAQKLARGLGTEWVVFDQRPGWLVRCPVVMLEYNPNNLGPRPEGVECYYATCLEAELALERLIRQHDKSASDAEAAVPEPAPVA